MEKRGRGTGRKKDSGAEAPDTKAWLIWADGRQLKPEKKYVIQIKSGGERPEPKKAARLAGQAVSAVRMPAHIVLQKEPVVAVMEGSTGGRCMAGRR